MVGIHLCLPAKRFISSLASIFSPDYDIFLTLFRKETGTSHFSGIRKRKVANCLRANYVRVKTFLDQTSYDLIAELIMVGFFLFCFFFFLLSLFTSVALNFSDVCSGNGMISYSELRWRGGSAAHACMRLRGWWELCTIHGLLQPPIKCESVRFTTSFIFLNSSDKYLPNIVQHTIKLKQFLWSYINLQ